MNPETLRNWTLLVIAILGVPVTLLTFIKLWREVLKTDEEKRKAKLIGEILFTMCVAVMPFISLFLIWPINIFVALGGITIEIFRFTLNKAAMTRGDVALLCIFLIVGMIAIFGSTIKAYHAEKMPEIRREIEEAFKARGFTNSPVTNSVPR